MNWLFSAVFHGIGMAVWAAKTEDEFQQYSALKLGWSWGFAIAAAALQLGALVPIIKSQRRDG